ncbi:hypothetical protein COMNV_00572 [Commensalibacter sp. Nvir]|uniref:Gp138 family membrane-puncturing spike protein n=1 Tax=Commensalibacter sp. Nvir TaxID=3069817 RepID=UPI002D67AD6C|nr:hypothetical protein COMNV_00572 [Commensalibacter sp. Nvir]
MSCTKQNFNHHTNILHALIENQLNQINTAMVVKVTKVNASKRVVHALSMVQLLDNQGNAEDYAPLLNIPYVRLQGGGHGIICDPQVGDIGVVVFASRDISSVIKNKKKAPPASWRTYSISDGMYIASLLLNDPSTYIKIAQNEINIKAPTVTIEGELNVKGDVIADGISLKNHVHSNGNKGENTGKPI